MWMVPNWRFYMVNSKNFFNTYKHAPTRILIHKYFSSFKLPKYKPTMYVLNQSSFYIFFDVHQFKLVFGERFLGDLFHDSWFFCLLLKQRYKRTYESEYDSFTVPEIEAAHMAAAH